MNIGHGFAHLDQNNRPQMVDVSKKTLTAREATARSILQVPTEVMAKLVDGELRVPKGPVFATAIIAGVLAAKKTHELIPFCHSLVLDDVSIEIIPRDGKIELFCTVKTFGKTGVEMEALVGASIASLTIIDMCKSICSLLVVESTQLIKKSGGKHDFELKT